MNNIVEAPLTEQLRKAITKRDKQAAKAQRHADKLEQREADVQRLIGELEREIEEATGLPCSIGGFELVEKRSEIPEGVDPDDPKTWKEGDVVECLDSGDSNYVTSGNLYRFKSSDSIDHVRVHKDDEGRERGVHNSAKFRFVRRPS